MTKAERLKTGTKRQRRDREKRRSEGVKRAKSGREERKREAAWSYFKADSKRVVWQAHQEFVY